MAKSNPSTRRKKQQAEALLARGALNEARALYQQVCHADGQDPDAWIALGSICGELGRFQESAHCFKQAIQLSPDSPAAHFNLAKAMRALGRLDDAEKHYRQALKLKPNWTQAFNNLGNLLHAMTRDEEAIDCYRQALAIEPNYLEAKFNYANLIQTQGRHAEAIALYRELLTFKHDHVMLLSNLAKALAGINAFDEALACLDRVMALTSSASPVYAEAAYDKSLYSLLLGRYEEGWKLHEWRWRTAQFKLYIRQFRQPLWLGEHPIAGKTILLHAEQGFGDVIQFVRYVPLVEGLGAKVILELPAALVTLIATLQSPFQLVAKGDRLPEFDLHCPLMSLPLALNTTVDTIPADIPYLAVDAQKQAEWLARLGPKTKPRIGLVWSGNPKHPNDRNRSIPLPMLAPLLAVGVEYHSLQKEVREEDRIFLSEARQIRSHENALQDFADTAALIANLDLVIAVDTSVVHLAGALGKPVWMLLPYSPDFRWFLERNDSPWYPTARLFRQPDVGDWDGMLADVVDALERRFGRR